MRRIWQGSAVLMTAAAAFLTLLVTPALADDTSPAGGVPTQDLIPAAIVGTVLVAAVAVFGWAHRKGATDLLNAGGRLAQRVTGLPPFAAIPVTIVGSSLLIAVFGFYWDVSTHIDNGRDPGPFANPSHWLIIIGLLGIALAGVLSMLIGVDEEHPTGIRIREGWHVAIGSILITVCGVIALLGFPMDDVWHRIFGQDVTLWSPTHIQMVGGASLSTLCLWILLGEARRDPSYSAEAERFPRFSDTMLAGAFLIGASTLQAEFDYAVPQFRLLYQPVLIMVAAGLALVPARVRLGRGGALKAALVFIAIRGILTLLVTPVMGRTLLHFPLYLGAAVAVELAARFVSTERQLSFGAAAGVGIVTLGLAAEWLWTHIWMPIAWPASMLVETIAVAVPAGLAAAVVGGFISRALAEPNAPRQEVASWIPALAGIVVLAALIYPIPMTDVPGASATVTLADAGTGMGGARAVDATIRLEPADLGEGAEFVNVTTWQGAAWQPGVNSFADPLEKVEPGVYRTTRPIPVDGEWKSLIRLHDGRAMIAAPIFLPEDPAIPAAGVPAEPEFTREFILGQKLLLREAKEAPSWITVVAYLLTLAVLVIWIGGVAFGVRHLRRKGTGEAVRHAQRSPRVAPAQ